jgi:hypothetical protein
MAQVNSTPGQNQTFGNVAVAASPPYVPVQDTRAKSTANIVAYGQVEPGRHGDRGQNPLRS